MTDQAAACAAAKRYYAEIMMPLRSVIRRNLAKVAAHDIGMIAPSHGPRYGQPAFSKAIEQIAGRIPNLKVEILDPVLCRGCPRAANLEALERLATAITAKHAPL